MAKMSIAGNASDTYFEENVNPIAFLVNVYSTTITDVTIADMELMNMTVTLQRKGQAVPIVTGNLWALGNANNPSSYEGLAINSNSKSFRVALPGIINLKDGDRLQVTFNSGVSNTGQVVTVCTEYGCGIEYFIPTIIQYSIPKTRVNEPVQAGNNVVNIAVVHTSTDFVISGANVKSTFWQCDYQSTEWYALMAEQWERAPEHFSFIVYSGDPLQSVNANLNITTTASGNGYMVIFGGIVTQETKSRAKKLFSKIATETAQRYGV